LKKIIRLPQVGQIGFSAVRAFMPYDGTDCALRFLRQPSRPIAPRPVANNGRAVGSGVTTESIALFHDAKLMSKSAPDAISRPFQV
jgi:hypothetical protein